MPPPTTPKSSKAPLVFPQIKVSDEIP